MVKEKEREGDASVGTSVKSPRNRKGKGRATN